LFSGKRGGGGLGREEGGEVRGSERRERLANKLENKMLEQDFVSILGSISGRIGSISTELILNRK